MPEASNKVMYLYRRWLKTKQVVQPPNDVEIKFRDYSERGRMSKEMLHKFLVEHQKVADEDADDLAQTIINKTNLNAGFKHCRRQGLSLNGFFQYLLSNQNPPLFEINFDGEKKLARYYIYTSHRSYLKQDKTSQHHKGLLEKGLKTSKSKAPGEDEHKITYSSIHAIEKALAYGVRVLELDLCPSSDKSDIHVHPPGSTAHQSHSSVTLKHCFEVINEKAFHISQFPLMIILVEHFHLGLSADEASHLQSKIKERIHSAFDKNKLCSPDTAFDRKLNSLKEKIIILTRHQMQGRPTPTDKHQDRANKEYANGYIQDLKQFSDVLSSATDKLRISSLTENELETIKSRDIIRFTQNNLLAVYPNPELSSKDPDFSLNYDPLISWTRGAQMVAFNMQDDEKYLWIMQGLFRAQGGKKPTGYVKKPDILLNAAQNFDPEAWRPVTKILKVRVYLGTGWHLDFSSEEFDEDSQPDFFTAVEIVGVPADEAREKTAPSMDQNIPVWNQDFEFPLTVPELAMLVIEVRDFDTNRVHEFGGQSCLPVCQLSNGIRCVPLYDRKGKPYRAARLLVKFQLD